MRPLSAWGRSGDIEGMPSVLLIWLVMASEGVEAGEMEDASTVSCAFCRRGRPEGPRGQGILWVTRRRDAG